MSTAPTQVPAEARSALPAGNASPCPRRQHVLDTAQNTLRPVTANEYVQALVTSGLLSREDLKAALAEGAADITTFETRLISRGLVTPWQSNMLRVGFNHGYFLGRYRLLKQIGSGGMARVYLAEHDVMKRRVAVKVLSRLEDPSLLKRFMVESRAIATLDHPNIVRVHHFDSCESIYYLVMEYVEGEDVRHMVERRGPLPFAEAASILRQAAAGLLHAHQQGMIHRDVKPANLLMDQQGVVKVADLGLAHISVDTTNGTQTSAGGFLGTINYIAPEQVLDSHAVDARADLYGLGCTLYFMLCGIPPFQDGRPAERMAMQLYAEPANVLRKRPDAPPELARLCQRLMAKRADDRPQSAAEVCAVLNAFLTGNDTENTPAETREISWDDPQTWSNAMDDSTASPQSTFTVQDESRSENRTGSKDSVWPEVMLLDEVAAYLRISVESIQKLALEGRIPSQLIGTELRFHRDGVSRWLRETNFGSSSWNNLVSKPSLNHLAESKINAAGREPLAPKSIGNFVETLRASGLLNDDEVVSLAQYALTQPQENPQRMALELARQGKLTDYQVSLLLKGKTDGLAYGNYTALDRVGSGGMATVYKAQHRQTGQVVALKVLSPESSHSDDGYRRFDREIRAIARLNHPNIVRAIDASYQDDMAYFVMEYVDGPNLHQIVRRRGPLDPATAIDYISQAARGLDHAHQQGIIHRDVKPGNLLLNSAGVVKLLDMGLVRFNHSQLLLDSARSVERITREESLLGTPDFMAPEQFSDPTKVDLRADVYSLGCTLYFMLTGKYPFDRDNINAVLTAHQTDPIPQLAASRDDIPAGLQAVLGRMLSKIPSQRQASMVEVIDDLQRVLDRAAHQEEVRQEPARPSSPTRTILGSALVMTIVAAVVAALQWPRANQIMNMLDPGANGVQQAILLVGLAGIGGATLSILVRELLLRK